jgi:hypothetical protein
MVLVTALGDRADEPASVAPSAHAATAAVQRSDDRVTNDPPGSRSADDPDGRPPAKYRNYAYRHNNDESSQGASGGSAVY